MKISPTALAIVAALLALTTVTAFVPSSCGVGHGHVLVETKPFSTTACRASDMDVDETSASSSSPTFPFSDTQVRFAYDEWRLIYGKGGFDPERFENFKLNHKTLTISNLKAREKAVKEGRPIPQWMSLNEYGDYSLDEYEAMMRGEKPRANEGQSENYAFEPGEQLVRGTQPVNTDGLMNYSGGQVQEYQYQDQFGRTIRSTQALSRGTQSLSALSSQPMTVDSNYANNIDSIDASSRGTLMIPKDENDNNQSQLRVTQVIGTNDGSSAVGGTQVVGAGPAPSGTQVIVPDSAARGTQVVSPTGGAGSGTSYGTQVISGADGRGTQVLGSGEDPNSGSQVYGYQAPESSSSDANEGTESQTAQGTLMIPRDSMGTQFIPNGDVGTQMVPNSDVNSDDGKEKKQGFPNIFDGLFGDSEKEEDKYDASDVGKRGTMVIKRSIEVPEEKPLKNPFSFFGTGSADGEKKEETEIQNVELESDSEPAKSNGFFDFLSPKNNSTELATAVKEEDVNQKESNAGGGAKSNGFFDFLSPKNNSTELATTVKEEDVNQKESNAGGGIFSLFGGDVKSEGTQPVRSSISLETEAPMGIKIPRFGSRSEKNLSDNEVENDSGTPSILSFFGGAKKVSEEDSEPTATVQKPKKFEWISATASKSKKSRPNENNAITARLAKQREGVEMAEAKRLEREKKREAMVSKGKGGDSSIPKPPNTVSPFSFFGAIGRKADPPTLKKWRQNRDGTITGMIYDSKNFKDGTRITTSPVPAGAKKGIVVKTGGGSRYSLT